MAPFTQLAIAFIAALLVASACSVGRGEPANDPALAVQPGPGNDDACERFDRLIRATRRGYFRFRSADVIPIPREPNFLGTASMPPHSGPWDYLTHVPLVLYGRGHILPRGEVSMGATLADLAPTAAHLVGFDGFDAPHGRVLDEALLPRQTRPRVVITIVWDGGGWNVLKQHEGEWPYLAQVMAEGASYTGATIASSPSVTPPIHATIGTGAFPSGHGIPGLNMRTPDYRYVNPFAGLDTDSLEVPALAELYDVARDNEPVAGVLASKAWHLGMIGNGTATPGGDADPVALVRKDGTAKTNEDLYSLPGIDSPERLLRLGAELDAADGKRDKKWMGNPIERAEQIHATPAMVRYDGFLLRRLIKQSNVGTDRVPDLLYVNFKTADVAGHAWGMTSDEVRAVVRAQDDALRKLVEFLDRRVGNDAWVLMLTADHGQTPYPSESGAWPISITELVTDLNKRFDTTRDGIDLIDKAGAAGVYVRRGLVDENRTSLPKIGRWLGKYTIKQNLKPGQRLPEAFAERGDEHVFEAVLAKKRLVAGSCS